VSEQALPRAPKSADRIDGAMMAGGDMAGGSAAGAGGSVDYGTDDLKRQWQRAAVIVEIDCDG